MVNLIIDRLAEILGIDPASIDPNERFSRYGLSSRLATGLIARLAAELERPLPATLVWDHPTATRLARFLTGQADTQATVAMRRLPDDEPIAIIAMACRLPGAHDPEAFWRLLLDGVDAVGPMPEDRWKVAALYDPDPEAPGRMATRWGGFLDQVDGFDAEFFAIAPREALEIDPQQRLVLELAWEALERAAITPSQLAGSRTGVFIGAMWAEYGQLAAGLEAIAQHSATGRDTAIIANRVSYLLGLTGPSLTVNTACSSSLVALHLASQSLRDGESTLALAGGVNLILTPDSTVAMTKFGAMAPDGRSKAFDARANGYVRGEGAGVVLLKPLSQALADGDPIWALLRGSAVNNDGPSNGLTAPSPDAQRAVLGDAYARAGVAPADVDYVEAHGTGTLLGDPIEAGSLGAVLGTARSADRPLIVGSAKTNIGHLEAAAGIAGLMKATLALHHRVIPPSLHFLSPNPNIDFARLNLRVPVVPELWPTTDRAGFAGVSSFGFGGTNAHAVLQEWRVASPVQKPLPNAQPQHRPLIFIYSGNGAQWLGMGRDLLAAEPAFRAGIAECDAAFRKMTDAWHILDELMADTHGSHLSDTVVAQSLMFAVQIGLTCLLASWGYVPDAVVGHSLGEVAAACAAGILGVEDAARVVLQRSRLQAEVAGQGAMAQVALSWDQAEALLAAHPDVVIAGANAPTMVTLSGSSAAIDKVMAELAARDVDSQRVRVNIAYHSPAMDAPRQRLVEALAGLRPRFGRIPVYSTVTGTLLAGRAFDADYWGRNLREPVRFAQAVAALPDGVMVELSPHPILTHAVEPGLTARGMTGAALFTLRRDEPASESLHRLLEGLTQAGVAVGQAPPDRSLHLLTLSARNVDSLRALARRYAGALPDALADACYTANTGREPFHERIALLAATADEMRQQLTAFADDLPVSQTVAYGSVRPGHVPPVVLRFASDVPNLTGLAELQRTQPVFADAIAALDPLFFDQVGVLLTDLLAGLVLGTPSLHRACTFGWQLAFGRVLFAWGIRPAILHGEGVGYFVAEALAGRLTEDEALRLALLGDQPEPVLEPVGNDDTLTVQFDGGDAGRMLLAIVGRLAVAGVTVDWLAFDRPYPRRRVLLPTYPFQRVRYWPTVASPAQQAEAWLYELAWTAVAPLQVVLPDPATLLATLPDPILAGDKTSSLPSKLDTLAAVYAAQALVAVPEPRLQPLFRSRQWAALARLAVHTVAVSAAQLSADIAADYPQEIDELALIRRAGEALPDVLAGRIDPLQVLFPDGALDWVQPVYERALFARTLSGWVETLFAATSPKIHSVIEVGAGTGGTTVRVLPHVSENGRYLFTDISPAFLDQAQERFSTHPGFATARLDIERPPAEQGITTVFDAVLAVNVLHATRDIRTTLAHVRQLLRHGGWLVLVEVTGTPGWLDLVFGMLEGWWRFADSDVRPSSALLPVAGWCEVLAEAGFDAVSTRFDGDRQSLILARAGAIPGARLFLGNLPVVADLAERLRATGVMVDLADALPTEGAWRETFILDHAETPVEAGRQLATLFAEPRFGRLRRVEIPVTHPAMTLLQATERGWALAAGLAHPERWGGTLRGDDRARLAEALLIDMNEEYLDVSAAIPHGLRLRSLSVPEGGLPVRAQATYLISGGLGALGLLFARWLVEKGARHLALVGRRPPSAQTTQVIATLEALGVQVWTFAADVADLDAMRRVMATLTEQAPPLAGVIHAAGMASDDLAEALAVKLEGAQVLDTVTATAAPELFLLFSSAAGVWGAKGKEAYAAANAALDAFAAERQRQGLPTLSIAWGRFSERGLLSVAEDNALAELGLEAMTPEVAFALAWRLTGSERSHAVIAQVDWLRFRASYEARGLRPLLDELPKAEPVANEPRPLAPMPSDVSLFDQVRRLVAETLGHADPATVAVDRGLFELGLDSLMAVRLRRRLEEALGRSIPAATLFSHPTVTALADWLTPSTKPHTSHETLPPRTHVDEPIAVIGLGCRFPGGVVDPDGFARLLFDGRDAVTDIPPTRWDWREWFSPNPDVPGYMVSHWGGFLENVDQFDAAFFNISPKEAAYMDPQQRLLLEVAYEALERAGFDLKQLAGLPAGVFIGVTGNDYATLARRGAPEHLEAQAITGQPSNTAAGRVAFALGLTGPAIALDTACSSSLAALHLACRALRSGECCWALAGGVNLILAPETSVILSRAGMLSPTGRCRTFDAGADGFVRAEGCGLVVLKPLAAALADGDPVLAVVRGTAMNHDGRASGFTVPNGHAQEQVIRAALRDADVAPAHIAYVEAHGTGTALGDPIEVQALAAALGEKRTMPLWVGSVKTNIGHAESAAGIAAFIKTVLALEAARIPANLHFARLNPQIHLDGFPLIVPTAPMPWPLIEGRRLAGVSSFGASGTNVHVIVEAAPPPATSIPSVIERGQYILPLSAGDPASLTALAVAVAAQLDDERLADLVYSAGVSRSSLPVRGFAVFSDAAEGRTALTALTSMTAGSRVKVAFLFTGQGAQYAGMARTLYPLEPVFREVIDRCDTLAEPLLGRSLREAMLDPATGADLDATALAQPALFTLGCALAALWRSWAVEPAAVLGHSVGEYAAAVIAGVLELETALPLVIMRGRLMQALPAGGGMRAVLAPMEQVAPFLAEEPTLSLAALNSPANTVISGSLVALERLSSRLVAHGVTVRPLTVSHAFHSALLDPMLPALEVEAARIAYQPAQIPFISNLTGTLLATVDAAYWRCHAREPVRFAQGLQAAAALGCRVFVEMGPQPVLTALAAGVLDDAVLLPSLRRDADDQRTLYQALGRVWQAGVSVDWAQVPLGRPHRRVVLPTTPFHRKRHWLEWMDTRRQRDRVRTPSADWLYQIEWERRDNLLFNNKEPIQPGLVWQAERDAQPDAIPALCADLKQFVENAQAPVWVVTCGAQPVLGSADVVNPASAAVWGLGRILALTHPEHWGGLVDLDPTADPAENATALTAFLADPQREDQAALRGHQVYVPRLTRLAVSLPEPRPIHPDRTYLITGGFGGLGLALADYLATAGARYLVLIGRRSPNVEAVARIAALESRGITVTVVAADVADAERMAQVAAQIEQTLPPVVGIFHAAGVKDGDFAEVLRPKLTGAQVLHDLSGDWPVEEFVLFSSAAAVWGDRHLEAYATANATLDGFAHRWRVQGRPALSVNWGRFDVRGMLDTAGAEFLDRMGLDPLPVDLAFHAMRGLTETSLPQVTVAAVRWAIFKPIYEGQRLRPLLARLGAVSTSAIPKVEVQTVNTAQRSLPTVLARLRQLVAEMIGRDDPAELDTGRGFFALGLDSFGIVDLRRRIETEFGVTLPAATLFEAPSIMALAARLASGSHTQSIAKTEREASPSVPQCAPIAIIGLGLRLPGEVHDLAGLERLLLAGIEAVGDRPEDRCSGSLPADPVRRRGGFLTEIDRFDADFFGISPREAAHIDPQHRLLLEVAWEALQHAGLSPSLLAGQRIGVFIGITGTEYAALAAAGGRPDAHAVGGQFLNVAAGRISYTFGLTGPSLAVDTACSSSAMAVHLAGQALRAGECDLALAGGVNLMLAPETTEMLIQARMLAADGRCKTFDEAADGYVRAEGCGLVVLKPLAQAEADSDRIWAVIRGTAVNHDGASSGFTVPNGAAQEAVMRAALAQAEVNPADVFYVEAHGTGTALGDPIELHALDAVYGGGRNQPLWVGSIKTLIGHAEAAAGIAGLLKLVASLQLERIPPHLNFHRLNPHIQVAAERVAVVATGRPWELVAGRRLAGLSAFGASGTNVHLIIEGSPTSPKSSEPDAGSCPLILSARRVGDLDQLLEQVVNAPDWRQACREAALVSDGLPHRFAVVARQLDELRRKAGSAPRSRAGQPRIAFLFTGQGAQYPGMGRMLYQQQPVFRAALDRCTEATRGRLAWSLPSLLLDTTRPLVATEQVQPALFALGYALAELWRSWGVEPVAVLGHSVGEITAACVAGAMSLEDALALIIERGRLMGALPPGGAMAAVLAPEAEIAPALLEAGGQVVIAARNGPANTVLSGDEGALERVLAELARHGVESRLLTVSHAFHSPRLDSMLDDLEQAASRITFQPTRIPVAANLDGQLRTQFNAAYWRDQARNPVAFAEGLATLGKLGCDTFIEIGPQPVLCGLGRACLDSGIWIPSLRRGEDEQHTLLEAVATAWRLGATVHWHQVLRITPRDSQPLPPYPFHRTRHWLNLATDHAAIPRSAWFQTRLESPALSGIVYSDHFGPEAVPGLADSHHLIHVGLHLAFLAAAFHQIQAGSVQLDDARFLRALVLDTPHDLQIVQAPDGQVTLFARTGTSDWVAYVQMHINGAAPSLIPALDLQTLRLSDDQTRTSAEFYADLAARGFPLGARLRRIERLWCHAGEALAQLSTPESDEPLAFGLPAALLEACAQLPIAACPEQSGSYLLIGWRRFIRTSLAYRSGTWIHATASANADGSRLTANITLCTDSGEVLVRIEEAVLARVDAAVLPGRRSLQVESEHPAAAWMGELIWALAPTTACVPSTGRLIATGSETQAWAMRWNAEYPDAFAETGTVAVILMETAASAEPLALAHVLTALPTLSSGARLLLVSRGVWIPGACVQAVAEGGAGVWGLAQTVRAERADLLVRSVDLDPDADPVPALRVELADVGAETASAWRQGQRFVARLQARQPLQPPATPMRLVYSPDVAGEGVKMDALERRAPGPGEVEIAVIAAAPNFRDLLVIHGQFPATPGLGADGSGLIVSVGSGVTTYAVGDPVIAYVPHGQGSLASHITLAAQWVRPKPQALSFKAAAVVPVAYLTAWHGLIERAQLQAGETVLIHAASSGVGWAALAIARWIGAHALATAGISKHAHLKALGVPIIGNSRDASFAEAVRQATGGRGVDVAIGAFDRWAGAAQQALALGGRLIDLTRRGAVDEIDLDHLATQAPEAFSRLFDTVTDALNAGRLPPIPHETVSWHEAVEALYRQSQGRTLGRLSVQWAEEPPLAWTGTWLITGASGALGLLLTQHLVVRGVRHLVLLDRVAPSPEHLAALTAQGVDVRFTVVDVSDEPAMTELLARVRVECPPLTGIIHTAAMTDDAPLNELDASRFAQVFQAKVVGARLLDRLSRGCPVRVFALFSSVVALLPSARQGAYAAANAALDQVARQRRAHGLPATAIHWGPWHIGIGQSMGARAEAVWRSWGVQPLTASAGLALFDAVVDGDSDPVVLHIDWERYLAQMGNVPPWLTALTHHACPAVDHHEPLALSDRAALPTLIRDALAQVLGHAEPAMIEPDRPFSEQGLDSLMATELATTLSTQLGIRLPGTLVYNYPTLDALVAYLLTRTMPVIPSDLSSLTEPTRESKTSPERSSTDDVLNQLEEKLTTINRMLEQN